MERIFAPWRIEYINDVLKQRKEKGKEKEPEPCFLCEELKLFRENKKSLVIFASPYTFAVMNKFPYNSGHIIISPVKHVPEFVFLEIWERFEIIQLISIFIDILRYIMSPQGFNIGVNIGKAAGAGLEEHLHLHIVPRWIGDSNFTTTCSEMKVIPEDIYVTADKIRQETLRRLTLLWGLSI